MAVGHATTRLLTQHRYAEAEKLLRSALGTDPENAYLNLNLAIALQMRAEHAEALTALEAILARHIVDPFKPIARNLLAWSCYMLEEESRLASADEASRLALEAAPTKPHYLDTRGHVLLWAGNAPEAESHLLQAHELAKDDSTRAYSAAGLAIACHRQHRIDDAKTWLAKARKLKCDERLLARAVAEVEPLSR